MDAMRMTIAEWDGKYHDCLIIKHDFDTDWLILALEELEQQTLKIYSKLKIHALEYSKESLT